MNFIAFNENATTLVLSLECIGKSELGVGVGKHISDGELRVSTN